MVKPLAPDRMRQISDPTLLKALDYIRGFSASKGGVISRTEYGDESEGRRAVAECLRQEPPDEFLCKSLARLFDPEETANEREVVLKFRRRGRRQDQRRDLSIAYAVCDMVKTGCSVETAVDAIAELACLSPEAVWKIWGSEKKLVQMTEDIP